MEHVNALQPKTTRNTVVVKQIPSIMLSVRVNAYYKEQLSISVIGSWKETITGFGVRLGDSAEGLRKQQFT